MRAVLRRIEGLGSDVVDLFLPFLHAAGVILQRHGLVRRIGMGRGETQQAGDPVLVGEVLADTFLERLAELDPESRIFLLVVPSGDSRAAASAREIRGGDGSPAS